MTEIIRFSELLGGKINYRDYLIESDSTNINELIDMYKFLRKAMKTELTEKQSRCLTMFLIEGKPQKEIARLLGVNASTVNRHIAAAKKKLVRTCAYYGGFQ